jgi:hypothetical protein
MSGTPHGGLPRVDAPRLTPPSDLPPIDTEPRRSRRDRRSDKERTRTTEAPASGKPSTVPVQPMDPSKHKLMSKLWLAALCSVAVLVVLGVCGLGVYLEGSDERRVAREDAARRAAAANPSMLPRDISSRDLDPAPLTEKELFPLPQVTVTGADGPYQVLKTAASADCKSGANGDLGAFLTGLGCNQVVRGILKSPEGQYLITAGIFNLKDAASATKADQGIKPIAESGKGRLIGLFGGAGTESMTSAPSQVKWYVRGHFLAYAVVVRMDGAAIPASDLYALQLATDLGQTHLHDAVIGARNVKPAAQASSGPPVPAKS